MNTHTTKMERAAQTLAKIKMVMSDGEQWLAGDIARLTGITYERVRSALDTAEREGDIVVTRAEVRDPSVKNSYRWTQSGASECEEALREIGAILGCGYDFVACYPRVNVLSVRTFSWGRLLPDGELPDHEAELEVELAA